MSKGRATVELFFTLHSPRPYPLQYATFLSLTHEKSLLLNFHRNK